MVTKEKLRATRPAPDAPGSQWSNGAVPAEKLRAIQKFARDNGTPIEVAYPTVLDDHIAYLQARGRDTSVAKRVLGLPSVTETNAAANLYTIALDLIVALRAERVAMLTRLAASGLPPNSCAHIAGVPVREWRVFVKGLGAL